MVYSGHPSGPWDANFPFRTTMEEYASYLETIAEMGADTIWLLPIFDHREEADPERYLYAPLTRASLMSGMETTAQSALMWKRPAGWERG